MIIASQLLLYLVLNVILSSSTNIINPTISNSSGDYYITSISSTKNFSYSTILCRSQVSNCYIICDTPYGCWNTTINGTKAQYLQYDVPSQYSSRSSTLYSSSNVTIINCPEINSCQDYQYYVNYTNVCKLICDPSAVLMVISNHFIQTSLI